jgi:drug/metabolite transporter (DMT)-like permease
MDYNNVPAEYRPISAWGYVGYSLLYSIPVIGLIFLLVHTFSNKKINRRNYARSYWCWLIIALLIMAVFFVLYFFGIIDTGILEEAISIAETI